MYCIYVAILVKNDQQIIQIVEALKKAQAFEIYRSCCGNSNQKQLHYNF
jgi:F0F1-type ATP synthase alpha subunit